MDGPTEVSLSIMGVADEEELFGLSTEELTRRLITAPFPPSEKILGAVMIRAIADLRRAAEAADQKTARLILLAKLTLAVAIVAVVVAVAAAS
jgi:hypothetical protein